MIDGHANYIVANLDKKHNKNEFKCGSSALDAYLKVQASQDTRKNVAVTYVLTSENSDQVLGYYTLSSIGIFPGELPADTIKKLPHYPMLPGILLGRLAVDKKFQGKNIGIYLLLDALKRSLLVSSQIGIVAVVVDVKNDVAATFYKKYGFMTLPDNAGRMFLPITTVKKLDLE